MGVLLSGLLVYEEELRAMLAECRKKKDTEMPKCDRSNIPEGFWMDSRCQLHEITVLGPLRVLLPSPQMENQAQAQGSERGLNANYDKAQPKMPKPPKTGDATLDRLTFDYQMESYLCKVQNARDNESYYRCRKRKGETAESCKSSFVQMDCPKADAAMKALDAYVKSKGAGWSSNSGGGSGGGF